MQSLPRDSSLAALPPPPPPPPCFFVNRDANAVVVPYLRERIIRIITLSEFKPRDGNDDHSDRGLLLITAKPVSPPSLERVFSLATSSKPASPLHS